MINLPAIIVANSAAVALLLIVLFSRRRNISLGLFDEKLFEAMVWLDIALCFSETLSFCVEGMASPIFRTLALVFNSANYSLNILLVLCFTLYVDYKLFESPRRTHKVLSFLAIPTALIVIGSVVNLFTPVFFSISSENVYGRAPLHIVSFIISYAFLAYGVIIAYVYRKKAIRYLFLPVIIFITPVILASALQYLFYGLSLLWLGTAIGLASLYINVQNQASFIDSLSGVFNRQYLNYCLAEWPRQAAQDEGVFGLMLDVDEFKSINDRYGHLAGDGVIAETGRLLRSVVDKDGIVARYGGDEFIVLQRFKIAEGYKGKMKSMMDALDVMPATIERPYDVHFSIGSSVYTEEDTMDTFISKIDTSMYAVKNGKIKSRFIADRRKREADSLSSPSKGAGLSRMLIVEDDAINADILANFFHDDFLVEKALDGRDALKRLSERDSGISIVLLDLMMPDMDGFEVLERMRADKAMRNIPVVVVSGLDDYEMSLRAIKSGASDFVSKPVDPNLLRIRVDSAISKVDNERLRTINSALATQGAETRTCRIALQMAHIAVAEHDWRTQSFVYDSSMSELVAGNFDARRLWEILLLDMVADARDVEMLQNLEYKLINDRESKSVETMIMLKTPAGDKHRFRVMIGVQVDELSLTEKTVLDFVDLDCR